MSRLLELEKQLELVIKRLENLDKADIEVRRELIEMIANKQILLDNIELNYEENIS